MTLFLKQSTAAVVSFGPFLDKTDGVTEETGLVSALDHASTGIKLSKNGGALTIRHASVTATTYDAYGAYRVTLDTTDTNTLGTLRMAFNEAATCLPVWQDFMVLPANVYDSLVGGSDYLDVSAVQFAGQTITASGGVTIPAATLASTTNITAGTITTTTNLTNLPAAAALEATLTAMKGATFNGATDSLEALRDRGDAAWTTATGFSTLDAAGVRTAVGLASANLDTQLDALPTAAENAAAVMASTVETGLTLTNALRLIGAALAGKLSISGTTVTIRNAVADDKDRITATVNTTTGERSAITVDLS